MKYFSNIYANIKFKYLMKIKKFREPFDIERYYIICYIHYLLIYKYIIIYNIYSILNHL